MQKELGPALEAPEEQAAAFLAVAANHGYDFTAEEFTDVFGSLKQKEEGELSEEDVEAVAGGVNTEPIPRALGFSWSSRAFNVFTFK